MDQEAWNRRYQGHELVWTAQPNRFLVGETTTLRPARALDLACGEGRNGVWLAEQGWKVTGVDFSEVALEKARDLAARRGVEVEWVHADLLRYEPPISAFDLVLVFYLQVTAEKRSPILSRAATALTPGGTFLLVGHDASNLERGFGGPRDPDVLYTAEDVTADLTGLEIERATSIVRTVETDEGTREAIDVLVRARRAPQ